METDRDHFVCLWCGAEFRRRCRRGRKPCYCARQCRQRAYEARRRGLLVACRPRAAPPIRRPSPPPRYEAGRRHLLQHALRPDGLPDRRGQRVTLCGTYAVPTRPSFGLTGDRGRACITCSAIAATRPPPRFIDPGHDVAVLTNLAARLRTALALDADLRVIAAELVAFCWPADPTLRAA